MSLYRCCRAASVQARRFSTSSTLRVGPESPNFIDVPQTLQPDLPSKPKVKGTLPVPRELFPTRRPDKATWAYVADATPEPKTQKPIPENDPHAEEIEGRRRMAEVRRRNLREGLAELYERKTTTEKRMQKRSAAKQAHRERILNQPEREDERLTRPSVPEAMKPRKLAVLPDPDREERLARARQRVEEKVLEKKIERQSSLQTLYMNARHFIVTEEQLAKEIDRVFPGGENEAWRSDHRPGENIWNLGLPPTIQQTVQNRSSETGRWTTIQDRVQKLAEEITGGKI